LTNLRDSGVAILLPVGENDQASQHAAFRQFGFGDEPERWGRASGGMRSGWGAGDTRVKR
jgi:hypothetical protein